MISGRVLGDVLSEVVPLYVVMLLAYASVKWWKMFSPEQCAGINRFVAMFAIPLICFEIISKTDMNSINYRFIGADALQKVFILAFLGLLSKLMKMICSSRRVISLEWIITIFALSTQPNTFVVGFPLFKGMYPGEMSLSLLVQLIVLQFILWYNITLFLYEYRAATRMLTDQQLYIPPGGGGSSCRYFTPRTSLAVAEAEIYSVPSSQFSTPRSSSFDLSSYSTPRTSSFHHSSDQEILPVSTVIIKGNNESRPNTVLIESEIQPIQTKPSINEEAIGNNDGLQKPNMMAEATTAQTGRVMTKVILAKVVRKLIRNPNTYSSFIGLVWAIISTKCDVELPRVVARSIGLLADGGLGMAVFSLGLFIAMQPTLIPGGKFAILYSTLLRFLVGPGVMVISSIILGLHEHSWTLLLYRSGGTKSQQYLN